MNTKRKRFLQRKKRVKAKVFGTSKRPRLSVFRSNKHVFSQIINDEKGVTLASSSDKEIEIKKGKSEAAFAVGEILAKKALAKKIEKVVFDKGGFKFHGRVRALAEGARKGGLKF